MLQNLLERPCDEVFLRKIADTVCIKETSSQVFSHEFWKTLQSSYLNEHFRKQFVGSLRMGKSKMH